MHRDGSVTHGHRCINLNRTHTHTHIHTRTLFQTRTHAHTHAHTHYIFIYTGISIFHFFLDAASAFFYQQFMQQLTTTLVGEPRPNMYYRYVPAWFLPPLSLASQATITNPHTRRQLFCPPPPRSLSPARAALTQNCCGAFGFPFPHAHTLARPVIYPHAPAHPHVPTCQRAYPPIHLPTRSARPIIHTRTHTHTHAQVQTQYAHNRHTRTHPDPYSCIRTHTRRHTHTHTHPHTHPHTHTQQLQSPECDEL